MAGRLKRELGKFARKAAAVAASVCLTASCVITAPPAALATQGISSSQAAEESALFNEAAFSTNIYNDRNGLPTAEANCVIQSSDGFIWIGSYGGLVRFDGTSFVNYSETGGFPTSSIRSLMEDSQGRLWVGTNDKGLFCYENGVFTRTECADETFQCVRYLKELSDGTIVACSYDGIGFVENGVLTPCKAKGIKNTTVYSVAEDTYGRIWADTDNGIVVVSGNTTLAVLDSSYFFNDGYVYCVASGSGHEIFVGSTNGVIAKVRPVGEELDGSQFLIDRFEMKTGSLNNLVVCDDNSVLACGLNGLAVLDKKGDIISFKGKDYVTGIVDAAKGSDGTLWAASSSTGLAKYSQSCFEIPIASDNSLEGLTLNAVLAKKNRRYVAYDNGVLAYNSSWEPVKNPFEKLDGYRVRNIAEDSQGNIWVAAYNYGVARYNPKTKKLKHFSSKNGLVGDNGRTLLELSDGSIVAGAAEGLSIIRGNKVVKNYDSSNGLDNTAVLSLLEGDDGTLYVGSDGHGIYAVKDDKVTNYSSEKGLDDGVVLRMVDDPAGEGIFVGAGSNLYYWSNGRFKRLDNFTKESGSIMDIVVMDGKLWVMQNDGVLQIDCDQLLSGKDANTVLYSFDQGLSGSLLANTHSCIYGNRLFMPTNNGVSIFDFEGINTTLPTGVVSSVQADGLTFDAPDNITLESDVQRITISFAAFNYACVADCQIAYQLEGFDSEETLATDGDTSVNYVSYTNLPGGDYTFNLRVFSLNDDEQEYNYQVQIHKEKKLTENAWYWALLAFLGAIVLVAIISLIARVRINKVRRQQERYKGILEGSLTTFANAIDAKDPYTHGHSRHVASYSRELARRLGMSADEQETIYYKALLHDIGKIGVPDSILNKPDKLTPDERGVIEHHVTTGANILKDFHELDGIADGARYHHERFDGKGYVEGKAGEDIPYEARIIAVADVYDALSTDRCYRGALDNSVIRDMLEKGSGTQFDPEIVVHMIAMIDEGLVPIRDE